MARRMVYRRKFKRTRGRKLNKRQKKQVKTLISRNQELKYFYANGSALTVNPTTAAATPSGSAFDIPQGTTDSTRIGDRIRLCGKIEFRIKYFNAIGGLAQAMVDYRAIIFQWKCDSSATLPTVGDILLNGPSGVPDVFSPYNHDKRLNYTILLDRTYKTTVQNSTAIAGTLLLDSSFTKVHKYKLSTKKLCKDIQYVGAGLQGTNRLYFLTFSNNTAATAPTYDFTMKTFYRDS